MKILLAIDSSSASAIAIEQTVVRPWPHDTTLEVLTVVEPWDVPALAEGLRRTASALVQQTLERLSSSGLKTTATVLSGEPKAMIIDRAAETKADLIVLGSRGVTGLTRFLLGSVALGVARFAPCSVEIARAPVQDVDQPRAIRILLATDGSEYSVRAAHSIADRPWPDGSEIHVISVVELSVPLFRNPYPPYFDHHAMEKLRGEAMGRTEEALAAAEEIVSATGLPVSGTVMVPCAPPKALILEEAQKWGADLIVVGSHGRRGFSRFLLGSVSEAVAAHAACSVDIIRQPV